MDEYEQIPFIVHDGNEYSLHRDASGGIEGEGKPEGERCVYVFMVRERKGGAPRCREPPARRRSGRRGNEERRTARTALSAVNGSVAESSAAQLGG